MGIDRNTIIRWAVISLLVFGFMKFGMPLLGMGGKHEDQSTKIPVESYVDGPGFPEDTFVPGAPVVEGDLCEIKTARFEATLSTRGAGVTHFKVLDPQYDQLDLSTTPDHERWRSLRTLFRAQGPVADDDQIKFDRFAWKVEQLPNAGGCKFTYQDDRVSLTKVVAAGERPYELNVSTQVTNLADAPKKHRFSIANFAFRTNGETKGHLGRVSPFVTSLECAREKDVTRKSKTDFKEGWFQEPLVDRFAAVSNSYFAQALVPSVAYESKAGVDEAKPECSLLAEELKATVTPPDMGPTGFFDSLKRLVGLGPTAEDRLEDASGAVYHAVLEYPVVSLGPKQTTTYDQIAYFGPKERDVLALAAGGKPRLGDMINLGTFTPVAKFLVGALVFFHAHVAFGNWGLSIIALTLCLRICLFPLSWKQIQTTIAMRRIKPEVDALNKKFPNDAQARQMAMMELYRKHGVNPLGGCLPQLVQLPIWWAMWATLQTAVEMYHEKFLWLSDLSAPDKFFILPLVYGVFIVLQQRLVPQQGMDPMQQKMMTYLMPIMFTVLVLFLPAALGLYMLTSSALGIAQQLIVEKIAPRNPPGGIVVKQINDDAGGKPPAFGKGKVRV
jgi:YidC/Oxa1 family membrane protein insertase